MGPRNLGTNSPVWKTLVPVWSRVSSYPNSNPARRREALRRNIEMIRCNSSDRRILANSSLPREKLPKVPVVSIGARSVAKSTYRNCKRPASSSRDRIAGYSVRSEMSHDRTNVPNSTKWNRSPRKAEAEKILDTHRTYPPGNYTRTSPAKSTAVRLRRSSEYTHSSWTAEAPSPVVLESARIMGPKSTVHIEAKWTERCRAKPANTSPDTSDRDIVDLVDRVREAPANNTSVDIDSSKNSRVTTRSDRRNIYPRCNSHDVAENRVAATANRRAAASAKKATIDKSTDRPSSKTWADRIRIAVEKRRKTTNPLWSIVPKHYRKRSLSSRRNKASTKSGHRKKRWNRKAAPANLLAGEDKNTRIATASSASPNEKLSNSSRKLRASAAENWDNCNSKVWNAYTSDPENTGRRKNWAANSYNSVAPGMSSKDAVASIDTNRRRRHNPSMDRANWWARNSRKESPEAAEKWSWPPRKNRKWIARIYRGNRSRVASRYRKDRRYNTPAGTLESSSEPPLPPTRTSSNSYTRNPEAPKINKTIAELPVARSPRRTTSPEPTATNELVSNCTDKEYPVWVKLPSRNNSRGTNRKRVDP